MDKRIPVTVLTGDAGVGKTTLLNRILAEDRSCRYALVVNHEGDDSVAEFAPTGIPSELIISTKEELFEMNSGCICCTIRGDLIRAIHALLTGQAGNFDAILIETAATSDPGPIIQTFFVDHILERYTGLDSVTAVLDANTILDCLRNSRSRPAIQQIAFADQIVLNKTETSTDKDLTAVETRLRGINPLAAVHRARHADVAIEKLLERGAFELERGAALPPDFSIPEGSNGDEAGADEVQAFALHSDVPMVFERVDEWLAALVMQRGADLLRGKGVIDVADTGGGSRRLAFQSVQMLHEGNFPRPWGAEERRASDVVFIGRNLDRAALQTGFMSCAAGVEAFALATAD